MMINALRHPQARGELWAGFRTSASSIALGVGLCVLPDVTLSQPAGAGQSQQVAFDIAAQDLNRAILTFASRAGVKVLYDTASVAGKRSTAVSGVMTPEQAMARLLAGTGVSYHFTSANSMSLIVPTAEVSMQSDSGVVQLDPIFVSGESAYGPVSGYVAGKSATASKTGTAIVDIPASVSVVSADQSDVQAAGSVVQALRYSSGVAAEVRGSATRYDIPYMRGFGAPGESVLFVDGLPLQRAASYANPQIDMVSVERVELLKGPSSSLYGGTQAGGLVNVVTKRPTLTPQGEATLTFGSHNQKEATVDVSGAVPSSKTLSYRFVGHLKDADTQVEHTQEQRLFLAPSLNWKPTDRTELNVALSYTWDPEGGYYGVLPTVGTLVDNPGVPNIPENFFEGDPNHDLFEREQLLFIADLSHRLSEAWTLRAKASLLDLSVDTEAVTTSGLTGTSISRYVWDTQEDLEGFSFDANVLGEVTTGSIAHELLIGVNHQATTWDYQAQFGSASAIDYLNPDYTLVTPSANPFIDQYQEQSQTGIYIQDQADLGALSLWGGLRYDRVETTTLNRRTGVTTTVKDDAFSGKLGAVYKFGTGLSVYGSLSNSFLPVTGTDAVTGQAFEPLTARQFEVGVKYEPEAFPGLFTLAIYDIEQDNTITTNQFRQSFQNGTTQSRGIEFEARFEPRQNWNIIAALGAVDAELVSGSGSAVGHSPVGTPNATASLWMDYTIDHGAMQGLMIGGGVRYVGSSTGGFLTNGTRIKVPDYTLVDAMLSYDLGRWGNGWNGTTAQLNVSNLLDNSYVTCLSNNFCNYGNGRSVSFKLARTW